MIPVVALADASPAVLRAVLDRVPEYGATEFKRLVKNTIGAIHQIPQNFEKAGLPNLDLKDIEAYFGRSSAGTEDEAGNVYQRFQSHGKSKRHEYGMIFAKTTIRATLRYETYGIKLIDHLREKDGLCISNKSLGARGNVGATEPGLLYMTFRFTKGREHARLLTDQEIKKGADQLIEELVGEDVAPSSPQAKKSVHEAMREGLRLANEVTWTGVDPIRLVIPS